MFIYSCRQIKNTESYSFVCSIKEDPRDFAKNKKEERLHFRMERQEKGLKLSQKIGDIKVLRFTKVDLLCVRR